MKKFLLLIREDINRLEEMSEAQMNEDIAEMTAWVEELARFDHFVSGDPLENESEIVGKPVATDGPFLDAKEGISGYFIIQADNFTQAVAIANQCPHIIQGKISIEVRPIMDI